MVKSKLLPSLLLFGALALGTTATPAQAQLNIGSGIVINDIDLTGVNVVDGVLTAAGGTVSGTIAGLPFTTAIENFELELIDDATTGLTCSVLDLELAPIDVDLLGLHVDTSPICLNLTAIEGGGLLGDLLCGLAGGPLGGLLDGLPALLTDLLNGVLEQNGGTAPSGAEDICDGECEVLDLAVGPVDLTLLGLNVQLDDCDNGPVQVCVSASDGEGLLGDLLCGLAGGGLLDLLDLGDLEDLLGAILDGLNLDSIQDLLDAILGGLDLDATEKQLNKIVKEVGKALRNGSLSNNELAKISRLIGKLL